MTRRRRQTRELKASQEYAQSLINSSLDMIISVDEHRRIVEFNPAAEETFGYAKEEMVGQLAERLYADPEASRRVYRKIADEGRYSGEVVNRRQDGTVFTSFLCAAALRNPNGEPVGVMGISRDITRAKQAERSMRTQMALQRLRNEILKMKSAEDWPSVASMFHEELRSLVEYTRWSISIVDERTQTVTQFFHGLGGFKKKEKDSVPPAILKSMATGRTLYRRDAEEMTAADDDPWLIEHGIQSVLDVPFSSGTVAVSSLRRDGFSGEDVDTVEQFAQVVTEAHRRVADMKALAYKEQQLRQAQKLEMIGQLGSGVAHEINNPLTVVMGQSELLLREPLTPEQQQSAQEIYRAADRARTIAERLLLFSRRQKADRQWSDLNPLVRETLEMMRHQFSVRNVQLVEEFSEALPQVKIHPGQIQQVLLNLIQNSRDALLEHARGGRIWVRTYLQRRYVVLEVEDDGPGILEGCREKIFEPFFTTKVPGVGTGLGLSVCHGIATDHDGHLYAKECDRGACFVLKLPVDPESRETRAERS